MSASIDVSSDCEGSSAAMATPKVLTFSAIKNKNADLPPYSNLLRAVPWRVLEDGTELLAPRLKATNDPFVIDLTPSEDDWLKVQSGVNYDANLRPHHEQRDGCLQSVFGIACASCERCRKHRSRNHGVCDDARRHEEGSGLYLDGCP